MTRWRAFAAASAAAAHLGCVTLGALHVDVLDGGQGAPGAALRAIAWYGAISGTDNGYGFFAPGVSALPWAVFEVAHASGAVTTETLESGANREAELRIRNIVGTFWNEGAETLRRSLVASWAGKVLSRHPDAESVVVTVQSYDLPSMQEIREGRRPGWVVHYRAKLVPQAKLRAARGAR